MAQPILVPGIDVTTYRAVIATATTTLLTGCECAVCGGRELELTGTWFKRWLGEELLEGRLGVCVSCGHHERPLPCEALPSKTSSIVKVIAVMRARLCDRRSVSQVAREHGVARATVRNWVAGLWGRVLDLVELLRRRAIEPAPGSPVWERLVQFAAFLEQVDATRELFEFVRDPRRAPASEVVPRRWRPRSRRCST